MKPKTNKLSKKQSDQNRKRLLELNEEMEKLEKSLYELEEERKQLEKTKFERG
jgi:uncharacterized protein YlxW (UPF0749 family)